MVLPTIPHVVRFAVQGTIEGGSRWANIWHCNFTSGSWPSDAGVEAASDEIVHFYDGTVISTHTGWIANFGCTGETLDTVSAIRLDGTTATLNFPYAVTGPASTPGGAAQDSFTLTLRTGLRGRSHRGRLFLPQVENSQVTTGQLNVLVPPIVVDRFGVIQSALESLSEPCEVVVASYLLATWQAVTSVSMDPIVKHQRRRRGRQA